jgi:Fic family protein
MKTIEALHAEWQKLQPLSPENQKKLDQKFMLDFNFNSNHLEGNTLTYGQTKLLLIFGDTTGDAKLRDYEEMKAHNVGLELVKREALDKTRPLTESFIRDLNRTILVENFWKAAKTPNGEDTRMEVQVGAYKTRPNSVITATGEEFEYASPQDTPVLVSDLVAWYNAEEEKGALSPLELASLFHYRYIRIHPFEDGNGRIARLLVNYILHRHGYPMVVVRSDDKESYLRILHQCDVQTGLQPADGANASLSQIKPFTDYLGTQLQRALELGIKAAKGESIEEADDFTKRLSLLEKEAKQKVQIKENIIQSELDRKWDIISKIYLPLSKEITDGLKPLNRFYTQNWQENFSSDDITGKVGQKIETFSKETFKEKKQKYLIFRNIFRYPIPDLQIKLTFLSASFSILFDNNHYSISRLGKNFEYGTFPTIEEIDSMINSVKNEALEKIEKAINGI